MVAWRTPCCSCRVHDTGTSARRPRRRALLCAALLLQREDPDDAALRDLGLVAQRLVQDRLLVLGIHTPAGLDRDLLRAVDPEGRGHAGHPGARPELPEHLAVLGVEGPERAVVGAAHEDEAATRGHDGPRLCDFSSSWVQAFVPASVLVGYLPISPIPSATSLPPIAPKAKPNSASIPRANRA